LILLLIKTLVHSSASSSQRSMSLDWSLGVAMVFPMEEAASAALSTV
jgi:hypothetical protein